MVVGALERTYDVVMETPFGWCLGLRVTAAALRAIDLLPPGPATPRGPRNPRPGSLAALVLDRLQAYFDDPARPFDLPLAPRGTDFQHGVWRALRAIPPGEVRRYGDLAHDLGVSPRAVGAACRANPLPIVVPCHRVVAATGLGGYAGARQGELTAIKGWLLRHEGYDRRDREGAGSGGDS